MPDSPPCVCANDRHPGTHGRDAIALLQLRHLTKNALQRVILQIGASGLRATPAGDRLADDLTDRICLSARLSDALFGLTAPPAPLHHRLRTLTEGTITLLAEDTQVIRAAVSVTGPCPAGLEAPVMQVAHEMVANAVKHGMRMRLTGRIRVAVRGAGDGVTLLVQDDGWGPTRHEGGDGMAIMRMLAARHGGTVALERTEGWTVGRLYVPARPEGG